MIPAAQTLYRQRLATPLGVMDCVATDEGICLLQFEDAKTYPKQLARISALCSGSFIDESHPHITLLQEELAAYFAGQLTAFSVPLSPLGTAFQQSVWASLRQIPFGKTSTYGQQSEKLGNPLAIRAVAGANAQNPLAIVVPCHRVIGSKGTLTGFSGGLWRKQKLLELEGALLF